MKKTKIKITRKGPPNPKTKKNKTRGGMGTIMSKVMPNVMPRQPSHINVIGTVIQYGLSSLFIAPIYLFAEFMNIPMNNLNNLFRNTLQNALPETSGAFLHVPFYKMITGCPIKTLNPDKFLLKKDMYIHKNVAVVSCDKDIKGDVTEKNPYLRDSILDLFGMIPDKRKLRHHVFEVFNYIDNLRETDEERKPKIQKLIQSINYKTLIKCYLIHRTLTCPNLSNQKTILADEDVVHMVNPLYYPSSVNDYSQKVSCMWNHLIKKEFSDEEMNKCKAVCKSCTFNNSVRRMTRKYFSMFSGGKISALTSMLNTYFSYLTIKKENVELPTNENDILKYLNTIRVSSDLNNKLEKEEEKEVLSMFSRFLCKYDIIPTVESQIQKKVKEQLSRGYNMKQILDFM